MARSHVNERLEQCIGKYMRIVFNDGHWIEGILEHKPGEWRYGMNGCDWHSAKDSRQDHRISGWFLFCHSNVRVIQEKMSLDKAIKILSDEDYRDITVNELQEAHSLAVSTMRKYQKIEDIIERWNKGLYTMLLDKEILCSIKHTIRSEYESNI